MNWHTFAHIFTPELARAMRYAVEESIRKCARSAGGGRSAQMADMAVERFYEKLTKHTGGVSANDRWSTMDSAPRDGRTFLAVNKDKAAVTYRVVYFDEDARDKKYCWHVEDSHTGFNHHADFFTHWRDLPSINAE